MHGQPTNERERQRHRRKRRCTGRFTVGTRVAYLDSIVTLERTLSRLSAEEMASALGVRVDSAIHRPISSAFELLSGRLGKLLARFDRRTGEVGIGRAARETLHELHVKVVPGGTRPSGSTCIVSNHPGAVDALALFSALERSDVSVLARDRSFLEALPNVSKRLISFSESDPHSRARALRRAMNSLRAGNALVQFGAGKIEADPAFSETLHLEEWPRGTEMLVAHARKKGALVVPTLIRGVHSRRVKEMWITKQAEARGITTVGPLLQVILRARDVRVTVDFGSASSDVSIRTELKRLDEVHRARVRT